MPNAILSLLLSMQLFFCSAAPLPHCLPDGHALSLEAGTSAQESRLWWGMIDPELAAWFARLPLEEDDGEQPVLWDWSWRGFLAAVFPTVPAEGGPADARPV